MKAEPGKPLSQQDVEKLISLELTAGQQYVYGPDNVASDRDRNFDYRRGIMNDLPAPPNRSKVTDRTVGAYIDLMKPSLLRIFTSGRNIGEYISPKPELTDVTKLTTRYVNDIVLRKDNRGELMLNDWAEDGLVQKLGTVMGWWEERYETKDQILDGVSDQALPAVLQEIQARGDQVVGHTAQPTLMDTPMGPVPVPVHSLQVRTRINKSKLCLDVIPPEEYFISRDARNDDDPVLESHRTGVMIGELIDQGFPLDVLNALPEYAMPYPDRMTKYNQDQISQQNRAASADPMLKKVGIARGRVRCDADGTGVKEWFFIAGGNVNDVKLLQWPLEPYNYQVFFANFCPKPVPHTVYGRCPADELAETQRIRTVITRQMLDNAYLHNSPQREVVMDLIIKPDQLMNMAPGAPVLVKAPNAIREIQVPFVGPEMLQVLSYFEGQAEIVTGVGRNTAGLDPEALSNQSATANNNMFSAMQGQIEQIARIWAHGGMRKLFRGILKCLVAYQDFARVVQIDGQPQTIDPKAWQGLDDFDIIINTGLGSGNRDRDYAVLKDLSAEQEKIMGALGPNNPIVDLQKAVRVKQMMAEAAGISSPENIFGDAKTPDGQPWQPQPPQPQPDANTQLLAQVENSKTAQKAQSDSANIQLEREKAIAEIASRERIAMDKNAKDYDLGLRQLGIDHAKVIVSAAKVDAENIRSDMEKGKAA